eukprot:UN08746
MASDLYKLDKETSFHNQTVQQQINLINVQENKAPEVLFENLDQTVKYLDCDR